MPIDASIYNNVRAPDVSPLLQAIQQFGQQRREEPFRKLKLSQNQHEFVGQLASTTAMNIDPLLSSGDTQGAAREIEAARAQLQKAGIEPPPSPILDALQKGDLETATKLNGALLQRMQAMGLLGGRSKDPSSVSEYKFFSQLTPEQQSQYLGVKRSSQTLNLGDRIVRADPATGQVINEYKKDVAPEKSLDYIREATETKERTKNQVELEKNAPKARQKISQITSGIDNTIQRIDEAISEVGPTTTGPIGSLLSAVRGTPAYNLRQTALTIKANIGFDRLQAMRDASPTGGALGQVAVQELEALQSTIASIDIGQSPSQVAKNLEEVKEHYENWRNAVNASFEDQYGGPARQQSSENQGGPQSFQTKSGITFTVE